MNALLDWIQLIDLQLPVNPEVCWRICLTLLHTVWQATCLWFVAWAISRQKTATPHQRFRRLFACLLIAGCLPVINYVVLGDGASLPDSVRSAAKQFDASGSLPLFRPSELTTEANFAQTTLAGNAAPTAAALGQFKLTDQSAIQPARAGGYWQVSTAALVTLGYLIGVALMLLRLGKSVRSQHQLKTSARTLANIHSHPRLMDAARKAADSLGRSLDTPIAVFESVGTAFVVGIFHPIILVNASLLSGLTAIQLQQILAHELAHIYRFDPLTQLLQRVIESVLFFHPAAWWISRHVSQLREICCDDLAARTSGSAEFADTLLQCFAMQHSTPQGTPELALPAVGNQKSQLVARIDALLGDAAIPIDAPKRQTKPSLSLVSRLCLACLFLIIAQSAISSRSSVHATVQITNQVNGGKSSHVWTLVKNIDDSTTAAPGLWFAGARLETTTEIPKDVVVDAMVATDQCCFAQWCFGSTSCKRVAVLIEMDGDQPYRVFVDQDRDRNIESDEELTTRIHDGKVWIAELPALIDADKDKIASPRQIAIYPRKDRIRIQTLGFASGDFELDGETIAFRRIDKDGDGIPVGRRDQLWLDLDSDGSFDPIAEQFNMADQLTINHKPYTVRSDRIGHNVTLSPQNEVGHLKFKLNIADKEATVEKLEGALRDENGMLIAVRLSDQPTPVPPGNYCLENLVVHIRDADQTTWRMTLSRGTEGGIIEVTPESTQTIPLLKDFQFSGRAEHDPDSYTGFFSHVRASIYTKNGLVITDIVRSKKNQPKKNAWSIDDVVSIREKDSAVPTGQSCTGFF